MSEFLTAGFNLHIMKEILDSFKTDHVWIDTCITLGAIYFFNHKSNILKSFDIRKVKDYVRNFFCKEIEYRLSSVRKTNYDGSFNVCHENLCSVCYYENKLIEKGEKIDASQIKFFEEFIVSGDDGYSPDESLIVPIGMFKLPDKNIRIETYLQNKEQDEKHGKKTEYKQIEISIFSKSHHQIQDFLEECLKYYKDSLDLVSNKEIKWFRLRSIKLESGPSYFSKKLEHKASFDNLFFDNKEILLKMMDDISSGKRDKICLLLHGPPGSGKDSIIVAMAKYLSELNEKKKHSKEKYSKKRHIVAYPLDVIHSSDDFMRVWHGRDKIDGYNIPNDQQLRVCPEMEKYNPFVVCNNAIKEIVNGKEKPEQATDEVFEIIQKNSEVDILKDNYELVSMIKTIHSMKDQKVAPKLQIAPVIECLDSFMNQRGTIVVFTTNLPLECINDVLIRHERLDKFYLGPSSLDSVQKIVEGYYKGSLETINNSQLPIGKLMPSDIHYYCKISSSLEECIKFLESHT